MQDFNVLRYCQYALCLFVVSAFLNCFQIAFADHLLANAASEGASKCSQDTSVPYDVHCWFRDYDSIRRHAKMTLREKFQSRHLLFFAINPMAFFTAEAEPLLSKMISKYTDAVNEMEKLPILPETQELHEGYLHYFKNARQLFIDICEDQKKISSKSEQMLSQLIERKRDLEILDQKNKELDARLRKRYDVAPFKG